MAVPTHPHLDPNQGSLEKPKVDPKVMQLSLAGFLDKHTAGFMRRCAVTAAGLSPPYTSLCSNLPTHRARRLRHALCVCVPLARVAVPRVSFATAARRSCQVRGWRTRDWKTTASNRPVPPAHELPACTTSR